MVNENELRDRISAVTRRQLSLHDLYAWLMARSWNMHRDSEPRAVALAAEVEALFFERSDGRIGEDVLRERLAAVR